MRVWVFTFAGRVRDGKAVIVAKSYSSALDRCKEIQPFTDEPICRNMKGVTILQPKVVWTEGCETVG